MDRPEKVDRVIAIGTSAGGLHALEVLLDGVPRDLPAPVLVLQHLRKSHPSHLAQILARRLDREVLPARSSVAPAPGAVYVAGPDHHLRIGPDRRLQVTNDPPVRFLRPSIDVLFISMADVLGRETIAVVLTGTGRDGAEGVRAVHDAGGVVIVQDPDRAEFPDMPLAAIATGCADHVLPLHEIAGTLSDILSGVGP